VSKLKPARLALGVVGLVIGVAGVLALREATLSTHEEVAGEGMNLVMHARTKGGEVSQTLDEMVEAQLLTCRLEVSSDVEGPLEALGDGRFRATLVPAMDQTNKRQFRGCIEDFITDHLQIDVLELDVIP
jgi:hypothetical protein